MPTIDDLAAAAEMASADEVAIWQAGATRKATRGQILTAESGGDITLSGYNCQVSLLSTSEVSIGNAAGAALTLAPSGSIDMRSTAGQGFVIQSGAGAALQLGILGGGPFINIENTFIELRGEVFWMNSAAATTLGTVIGSVEVHLPGGVTGYMPVYDDIT